MCINKFKKLFTCGSLCIDAHVQYINYKYGSQNPVNSAIKQH